MFITILMLVMWVGSVVGALLIGATMFTYIRRTWQLMRAEDRMSTQEQILDSLDVVQAQLYSMSDRLDRLERRLPEATDAELPSGDAEE